MTEDFQAISGDSNVEQVDGLGHKYVRPLLSLPL